MKLRDLIPLLLIFFLISIGNTKLFADNKTPQPNMDMQKVLNAYDTESAKPLTGLTPEEARKQPSIADAVKKVMKKEKLRVKENIAEEKIQVDGAVGKISATVYRPPGKDLKPIVVYFPGGGWVLNDSEDYAATARSLASKTNAIFVSVDYRRAPEHKFPAAHEDAFAAYKWVIANAVTLGGDSKKVAVAGESAGGNLALNVAIRARDEKIQTPIHQLIVYPVAGQYMETASYKESADTKPLNKAGMEWFFSQYLNHPDEARDLRINLVSANFLSLAPTTIISAEIDPLRSEGRDLADKMKEQNVDVDYKIYRGVTHEFFGMSPVIKEARKAQDYAAKKMKKSFKRI